MRVTVAVVRVEQQRRRGQPWRRWKETAISPLPRHNWIDGEVEEVEKSTTKLQNKLADAFLWWRACTMAVTLSREWWTAMARRCAQRKREGSEWGWRVRRAGTGPLLERGRVTWWRQQSMHATRRSSPEPVGHGDTDHFLKMAIQCSMTMTDSEYSSCQHG